MLTNSLNKHNMMRTMWTLSEEGPSNATKTLSFDAVSMVLFTALIFLAVVP
jgi:hypothetical protein